MANEISSDMRYNDNAQHLWPCCHHIFAVMLPAFVYAIGKMEIVFGETIKKINRTQCLTGCQDTHDRVIARCEEIHFNFRERKTNGFGMAETHQIV